MEISEPEKKKSADGDSKTTKRKMKTASQLELLEKTYAVENYPSEALRVELSVKLGLTDRQLQMWFCHRRLKDRKIAPTKKPRKETASEEVMAVEAKDPGSGSGIIHDEPVIGANPFVHVDSRKGVARGVPRMGCELPSIKRYYEPQSAVELRAIAFVESQLGEQLREDGPILGVEFDPLPPDAFGAPIAITGQPKQAGRPYDSKIYERQDMKSSKTSLLPNMEHCFVPSSSGGKRKATVGSVHMVLPPANARAALHEYQFLPEQPSVRSDTYERPMASSCYESSIEALGTRVSSLPTGGAFLHGNEQVATGYGFHGHVPNVSLLAPQGRHGHAFSSGSTEYESVPHKKSITHFGADGQFGPHTALGLENPFESSDKRACQDEDASRMEKKRKSEEARIAKEVEAHEKRIRKELEKQDILRRKREEQMRRELEKHDRERRKEEERLMREKQREEERFQREQKRENERRERFLQKETLRAEKIRHKEELRREKEAARLKAANERATARRIARESIELIEDERLELMELAASSKGLPSILSLDSETLENLELFRDMLSIFPPMSVQLKRPFAVQPWIDSEENIGNLLMVWRFLITFADVLEIWPFTLDEFVQDFHDYDPRLLGEIHIALLRSIIKDIEDVARTPSIGLGVNQNSAANPGGGHPQIVEGAYAWGFDIRSWQRHLNPVTWPEVLRQFALSAGFGPQLKKRSAEQACFRDDNEGQDGEDIVSTLRNGAAAENAVAMMQEKGFSHLRRSRHRLTPGTVKYAAFHVLSLEGSKGLTILEVADKIQKSGLRDLTTSKTPEASIAAALSRDTNLFERTAPSTYCVRAAFRKDPADADTILSAAREKIRIFDSGFSDSEEAEKDPEDVDDVERDEDFECDGPEDPEVDELTALENSNKEIFCQSEGKAPVSDSSGNEKGDSVCNDVGETPRMLFNTMEKVISSFPSEGSKDINGLSLDVTATCPKESNGDLEDTEIDESHSGEPWVQGLTEGEYSHLSVEERLNALVALIGVAIEGNLIRVILEERLEAANALKKQMWAEAQLDKRRMKEDMSKFQVSPFMGIKADGILTSAGPEGGQSPLPGIDDKGDEASLFPAVKQEPFLDPHNVQNYLINTSTERNPSGQEPLMGSDTFPCQQHGFAVEKSRSQLKAYIGHRAEELYVYRSLPLGQDRRRNRYWQFVTSASRNDPGSGRIFFESQDRCWRLIDTEEALDTLLAALDTRGLRESHLHSMLQKIEKSFKEGCKRNSCKNSADQTGVASKTKTAEISCGSDLNIDIESPRSTVCGLSSDSLELSSSFRINLGRNEAEKVDFLKRYQDFQKWLWTECFNPSTLCAMNYGKKRCSELLSSCDYCYNLYFSKDKHCSFCHETFESCHNIDVNFPEHVAQCEENRRVDLNRKFQGSDSYLPVRIRLLKAELALIEVSIPPEALRPFWTEVHRKSWGVKLHSSSSAEDLIQMLTLLEGAVKRDCLSSNFETTKELLGSTTPGFATDDVSFLPGSIPVLPWIPHTTAAVALRLMEFDSSISYMLHQKESHRDREVGEFIKVPSRYAVVKNIQDMESAEPPDEPEFQREENWADPGTGRSSMRGRGGGRGRGRGRGRGGRGARGSGSSRSESIKEKARSSEKAAQGRGRRARGTRGRGRGRGSRSARSRYRLENMEIVKDEIEMGGFEDVGSGKQSSSSSGGESSRSSGGEWDGEETRERIYGDGEDNSAGPSESDDNVDQGSEDESDDNGVDYGNGYNGKSEELMEESENEEDEDVNGDGDDGSEDGDGDDGNGDEGSASFSSEYSE